MVLQGAWDLTCWQTLFQSSQIFKTEYTGTSLFAIMYTLNQYLPTQGTSRMSNPCAQIWIFRQEESTQNLHQATCCLPDNFNFWQSPYASCSVTAINIQGTIENKGDTSILKLHRVFNFIGTNKCMIVVIVNFLSATNIICQFTGYFVQVYGDGYPGFHSATI